MTEEERAGERLRGLAWRLRDNGHAAGYNSTAGPEWHARWQAEAEEIVAQIVASVGQVVAAALRVPFAAQSEAGAPAADPAGGGSDD